MATTAHTNSRLQRLLKWAFNVVSVLSLLLCACATLASIPRWAGLNLDNYPMWSLAWTTSTTASPEKPAAHFSLSTYVCSSGFYMGMGVVHDFPSQSNPPTWPPDGFSRLSDYWSGMENQEVSTSNNNPSAPPNNWYLGINQYGHSENLRAGQTTQKLIGISYPDLIAIFAALPAIWAAFALSHLRRHTETWIRRQAGHCTVCGYDLCATPEFCPECGTRSSDAPVGKRPWMVALLHWSSQNIIPLLVLCIAVILFSVTLMMVMRTADLPMARFRRSLAVRHMLYSFLAIAICCLLACGMLVTWGLSRVRWKVSPERDESTKSKTT